MSRCALNCFRSKEMCVRGQMTWADKNGDSYWSWLVGAHRLITSASSLGCVCKFHERIRALCGVSEIWPTVGHHFSTSGHTEVSEQRGLERPWRSRRSGFGQLLPGSQSWPPICFLSIKLYWDKNHVPFPTYCVWQLWGQ